MKDANETPRTALLILTYPTSIFTPLQFRHLSKNIIPNEWRKQPNAGITRRERNIARNKFTMTFTLARGRVQAGVRLPPRVNH
jgi:hypothetical protein